MNKASEPAGVNRPAHDRRIESREALGERDGSVADVEATCRRIAEYLLSVSKDQQLEPALHEFMRTLDRGRRELDHASRKRSEQIYEAVFRGVIFEHEGRIVRERCDPFFWG